MLICATSYALPALGPLGILISIIRMFRITQNFGRTNNKARRVHAKRLFPLIVTYRLPVPKKEDNKERVRHAPHGDIRTHDLDQMAPTKIRTHDLDQMVRTKIRTHDLDHMVRTKIPTSKT